MQILEELGTFVVSLALALAILGVAAVMLYYFNPQQPVDHAKAAFYPLVKPLNATHVWLGVKPSADKVEVVELKYQYKGEWVDVPLTKFTTDRAVWLNTTDGRPVAVPCSANVTVATRYGTAARSLSFTPVCLQRDSVDVADVTEVFRQLSDYASYVANYVLYKSIPAITAYVRFGSMHVGIQDIAPFAFQVVQSAGAPGWQLWPPSYGAVNLLPLEARDIWNGTSAEPLERSKLAWGNVTSVMYRWLNVVVDWDSSALRIWVNNALAYNGTPPQRAATFTAPQGFRITFTPIDANTANVTLYYQRYTYSMPPCECVWHRGGLVWDKALSLTAARGRASSWSGWVKMINVPAPGYGETGFMRTIHVLPPAPYLGGDRRLFGAVTPFLVRSLTALRASNGTVLASYADENGAVKMLTFNTPNGTFYVEEPLYQPNNVPLGFRQVVYIYADTTQRGDSYAIALGFAYQRVCLNVVCTSYRYQWVPHIVTEGRAGCAFRGNWPYSGAQCFAGGREIWISWSIDSNGVVSVYRGGALQRSTRLGQLSAALAWTPDGRMYAASPGYFYDRVEIYYGNSSYTSLRLTYGPPIRITSDTARVSAPFAYRWSLSSAYNYTLTLSIAFDRTLVSSWTGWGGTIFYLYNVTYRGVMNLTHGGKPAAVDAFYGWYYMLTSYTPPPPPPPSGGPPPVEGATCIPTMVKIGEDQEHRELNKGDNGYSVQVVNYAIIRMTGCGEDYTYREVTSVTTLTADGNIYQVTDPCGRVCGYDQATTCNGVVYCGSCTCEQSPS
jgi:hypothetical protein